MGSKAEWLFLVVLFVLAVVTTVLYPPSIGVEGSDGSGLVEAFDVTAASDDHSETRGNSLLLKR